MPMRPLLAVDAIFMPAYGTLETRERSPGFFWAGGGGGGGGEREVGRVLGGLAEYSNSSGEGEQFGDFADSAAWVNQSRLVITVASASGPFAGALGKQVWMRIGTH